MKPLLRVGALVSFAAASGCDDSAPPVSQLAPKVERTAHAILEGQPADEAAYDAVGALVLSHVVIDPVSGTPKTLRSAFCTATLIAPSVVLTAKHCARVLRHAVGLTEVQMHFALGPDARTPTRKVPIADHFYAPGDEGGFVHVGRDVAVVFLSEEVTDVAPAKLGTLKDKHLGASFEVVGYGFQDAQGTSGTRRRGQVPLTALEGRVFERAFGRFEAFEAWLEALFAAPHTTASQDELERLDAGPLYAMLADASADASSGESAEDAPGSAHDRADWRTWYEHTVLLEGYEAFAARAPGGAQPCYGDSGGPLLRRTQDGALHVFGVASGGLRSDEVCDHGTVFATLGPDVWQFLREHKKDECRGLSRLGACDGHVLTRCSTEEEGKRRVVKERCAGCEVTEGRAQCVAAAQPDATPDE